MSNRNLADSVQIATGLALVIGLVLVLIELWQSKQLTLAELSSQAFSEVMENARVTMGENPAPVIARACLEPENLDFTDLVVISAYYQAQTASIDRLRILEAVASFGVPWQQFATPILADIMATDSGKQWLQGAYGEDAEIQAIMEELNQVELDCEAGFSGNGLRPMQINRDRFEQGQND